MKKAKNIIFVLVLLFFLHLTIRFTLNEIYINKYNDSLYNNKIVDFLHFLNYPESYVAHYNKGNNLYQTGEYEKAKEEYIEALKTVSGDRRCKVEINLTLTELELEVDKNTNSIDVDKLKKIQSNLLDSDCATKDNKGKNEDAQELYNELQEIIDNAKGGTDGDDEEDENEDGNSGENDEEEYEGLEEVLRKQQEEAYKDRQNLNNRDYEYYRGKKW